MSSILHTFRPTTAETRANKVITARIARSRGRTTVETSIPLSSSRASSGDSTGVLPLLTEWRGPRTACPVTSQSKRIRIQTRCCLTWEPSASPAIPQYGRRRAPAEWRADLQCPSPRTSAGDRQRPACKRPACWRCEC